MAGYEIVLKPSAVADMDTLRRYDARRVADAIEMCLVHEPTIHRKSRIKRLRGIVDPVYRLRVGEFRVFYSVNEDARRVEVFRVMHKSQVESYYEEFET